MELGTGARTLTAPYEKYAVCGETTFPVYRGVILAQIQWNRKMNHLCGKPVKVQLADVTALSHL
jgi:hypothetical protein